MAQWPTQVEVTQGIRLSLEVTNKLFIPGATNNLRCVLLNTGTNTGLAMNTGWGGTSVYLTNRDG